MKQSFSKKYEANNTSTLTADDKTANSSAKHSMIMDTKPVKEQLDKSSEEFVMFDINKLQTDMNKDLELQIKKMHEEFSQHNKDTKARLEKCE